MKKKTLLAFILAFVVVLVSSNVNAAVYKTNLKLPALDDLKNSNIEAYAEFGGYSYNMIYGLDNFMRYGMNDDGTYDGARRYNEGQGSDGSLPYPFDVKLSADNGAAIGVFAMALSSNTGSLLMQYANAFTAGYCIGWGVPFGDYEEADPFGTTRMQEYAYYVLHRTRNAEPHTEEHMRQVHYVLTYGYQYPVIAKSAMYNRMPVSYRYTVMDGMHWYVAEEIKDHHKEVTATQYAAWIASNGYMVDDPTNREKIENYFLSGNNVRRDGVDQVYYNIRNNVLAAMRMPSYSYATADQAKENAIELKWSEANQRFESYITDTNKMNQVAKVGLSYSEADSSLNFEQQADGSLLVWTKSVVGNLNDPSVFKVTKTINGAKKAMVISKIKAQNFQPIALAVDGEIVETQNVAVYTQALRIKVDKNLTAINGKYGDATAEGCTFGVYADEACTNKVADLTVKANGETEKTTYLPYQTYYLKETNNSESTIINETVYTVNPDEAQTDADGDFVVVIEAENKIVPTRLRISKYQNDIETSVEVPAAGAILRLELKSNPQEYYVGTVDKDGYLEFTNIPFGTYTLKEDDTNSNYHYKIQEETIKMSKHMETYTYRLILNDQPITSYLKIVKVDSVSNKPITIAGAKFKIWDCRKNDWVVQMRTPDGAMIDEFETNANGYLITPDEIVGGDYILYETAAPAGYYLNPKYAVPENEADLGDATKAGFKISLTTQAIVEEDERGNIIYGVEVPNDPLKGKLEIVKTGEMLTDADIVQTEYADKYTPVYNLKGLPGVTYEIYTAKEITSPDGKEQYLPANKLVDTITTGEDGTATTKELYLGEYAIKEVVTPEGFITDTDIENVVLKNDTTQKAETTTKELTNVRQKLKLTIEKTYDEVQYVTDADIQRYSVFGVYTNQDIKNYEGRIVIEKGSLVDVIRIENDEPNVTSTIDLPVGKYYIEEVETSYPYIVNTDTKEVELKYSGNEHEFITYEAGEFNNTYDSATITLIKVSSASLQNVILNGDAIEVEDIDVQLETILSDIKGMTEDEIKEYLEEQNIKYVAGAEYSVFMDEECTKPLMEKGENGEYIPAKLITNATGIIKIEGLPIGEYYLKETFAPAGYEVSDEVIKVSLTREDKDTTVYNALVDDMTIGKPITKLDIFTGEPIANCVFEIKDLDGNVLMHSVTNEKGEGYIPLVLFEKGQTYTYTEIEAPGIYDLNTEPHEFVAEYEIDEETNKVEWTGEKIVVENRRKTIDELIVRKLDEETGEPLEGCKFSIVLLDEEGNPFINQDGEMVYLVKEAVTGENGEYVVEKPYYGSYQFIEVEAPEGYEMKEDMNGMTFVIDENSPDTIIFEVTNTGDIAVIALAAVAVLSVAGIVFVIAKNRKKASKKA